VSELQGLTLLAQALEWGLIIRWEKNRQVEGEKGRLEGRKDGRT
jgi:hypothetical protein